MNKNTNCTKRVSKSFFVLFSTICVFVQMVLLGSVHLLEMKLSCFICFTEDCISFWGCHLLFWIYQIKFCISTRQKMKKLISKIQPSFQNISSSFQNPILQFSKSRTHCKNQLLIWQNQELISKINYWFCKIKNWFQISIMDFAKSRSWF